MRLLKLIADAYQWGIDRIVARLDKLAADLQSAEAPGGEGDTAQTFTCTGCGSGPWHWTWSPGRINSTKPSARPLCPNCTGAD